MAEAYSLSFHTVGGNAKIHVDTGYFLQKIIMIIAIPICTLGILGNVIVFWILCFRIQRTRFTVYFLNMTVADFTVLFHYVISFILFLKAVPISIFYLHLIELVHAFGFNASTYLLTALSAERYVMVFFPTWYQEHRPKHLSAILCIALWSLSGLISLLLYFSCYVQYDPALAGGTHICESTKMFRVIINILIFLPIMFFTSLLLFIRMTKVAKEPLPTRLDITIVTTVLFFILFSASVRIIDILAHWVPAIHIPVLFLVFHFLDSIDSSGNPFLYIFIGYLMKEESGDRPFQEMLERALLDEGSSSYAVKWDTK